MLLNNHDFIKDLNSVDEKMLYFCHVIYRFTTAERLSKIANQCSYFLEINTSGSGAVVREFVNEKKHPELRFDTCLST